MRTMTEDLTFAAHNPAVNLRKLRAGEALANADLWVRFVDGSTPGSLQIFVYLTAGEARTETPPQSWVAYQLVTPAGQVTEEVELTPADSFDVGPRVFIDHRGPIGGLGAVWSSVFSASTPG